MIGPLNGLKPSSALCRKAGCPELQETTYVTWSGPRKSYFCRITSRIPGNMYKCPKED